MFFFIAPEMSIRSLNEVITPALSMRCRIPRLESRGYKYITPSGLLRFPFFAPSALFSVTFTGTFFITT